jgi:hypothetical protein
MSEEKRIACLAHHGLAYYGLPAPSQQVVEAVAAHTGATIGDVVEIADESLAQGSVSPSLNPYAFIILVFPCGEQDEVKQDCFNYAQRTLGKTVQGVVWLDATPRIWGLQCREKWVADPPPPQSDGVHFTVELKRREPEARWELMERSWESPNRFEDEGEAEVVAHNLAIRHDGDMDTRVVSPSGVVLVTFRLQKYLDIRRRGTREKRKELPPNATLPMLHMAREGYHARKAEKSTP